MVRVCNQCRMEFPTRKEHRDHTAVAHPAQDTMSSVTVSPALSSDGDPPEDNAPHFASPQTRTLTPGPQQSSPSPVLQLQRRVVNRCPLCGALIYEKGGLRLHKHSQEHIDHFITLGLYCFHCCKTLTNPANKAVHDNRFHSTYADSSRTSISTSTSTSYALSRTAAGYCCPECDLVFSSKKVLERHLRDHPAGPTAVQSPDTPHTQPQSTTDAPFRGVVVSLCSPCGHCIYEKGGLKLHKKTPAHIATCTRLCLYCLHCDKTFANPDTRAAHDTVHDPERATHRCPDCCIGFDTEKRFVKHLRIHPQRLGAVLQKEPDGVDVSIRGVDAPIQGVDAPIHGVDASIRSGLYCFACQLVSRTPEMARVHYMLFHNPDNLTAWRCEDCWVGFCNEALLGLHLSAHLVVPMQQVWRRGVGLGCAGEGAGTGV